MAKVCPIMSRPTVYPNGNATMFHAACTERLCALYIECETNRHDTKVKSGMKKVGVCALAATALKNNMGRIID